MGPEAENSASALPGELWRGDVGMVSDELEGRGFKAQYNGG